MTNPMIAKVAAAVICFKSSSDFLILAKEAAQANTPIQDAILFLSKRPQRPESNETRAG
eukprot:CAMPEP_0196739278 /NCGR_PEP_ID=MMETSP1091-20130531/20942_1 /TAXON_ID=302021 /ORGANISM="Rhodomonas sp., Strain CCMP768" /LENGTH=58 /DNA_ID=CAMNT_0042083719 /DNA_START=177 /DNA_END=353 /DNA_ORIENTATION=-